ncbi:MAG: aminotransferase class IV [Chitinophagaceae bacterium]
MSQGKYILLNEKFHASDALLISSANRSFRYGDGFFETMKYANGQLVLQQLHFERLFASLDAMYFKKPFFLSPDFLLNKINALIAKNKHKGNVRVRINIFRGNGGLYDPENLLANVLIETWDLKPGAWNENGLVVGFYPDARKTCDQFSHLKTNNFLPYSMAALWAKRNQLNDAIVLNQFNRVSDATIANIFIVKDGIVKTPALSEGCIAGVMRKYLLQKMRAAGIPVQEAIIETTEMEQAAEIFFTNSIYNIRWVKQVGENNFTNTFSRQLWNDLFPIK